MKANKKHKIDKKQVQSLIPETLTFVFALLNSNHETITRSLAIAQDLLSPDTRRVSPKNLTIAFCYASYWK